MCPRRLVLVIGLKRTCLRCENRPTWFFFENLWSVNLGYAFFVYFLLLFILNEKYAEKNVNYMPKMWKSWLWYILLTFLKKKRDPLI